MFTKYLIFRLNHESKKANKHFWAIYVNSRPFVHVSSSFLVFEYTFLDDKAVVFLNL